MPPGIGAVACAVANCTAPLACFAGAVDDEPRGNGAFDAISGSVQLVLIVVMVGALLLAAQIVRQRLARLREEERMSESAFEAAVFNQVGDEIPPLAQEDVSPFEPEATTDGLIESLVSGEPQARLTAPAPVAERPGNLPEVTDQVLNRLKKANMVETVERRLELNGIMNAAAVVLLRDKRRVLVTPYFETELFVCHNLKRYDLVILVARDGAAVAVSPVENMIADSLSQHLR